VPAGSGEGRVGLTAGAHRRARRRGVPAGPGARLGRLRRPSRRRSREAASSTTAHTPR
jgi:hypothetical protein